MSQPLLASFRLEMSYQVDNLTHKLRGYADAVSDILLPSSWALLARDGTTHIDFYDAADAWSSLIAGALSGSAPSVVGSTTLQQLSGVDWNPVASRVTSGLSYGGGTYVPAEQLTIFMRDSAFKKVKLLLMESSAAIPLHLTNIPSSGVIHALMQGYTSAGGGASDPYQWVRSRGNRILSGSPFVSATTDFNDKLRRRRGTV